MRVSPAPKMRDILRTESHREGEQHVRTEARTTCILRLRSTWSHQKLGGQGGAPCLSLQREHGFISGLQPPALWHSKCWLWATRSPKTPFLLPQEKATKTSSTRSCRHGHLTVPDGTRWSQAWASRRTHSWPCSLTPPAGSVPSGSQQVGERALPALEAHSPAPGRRDQGSVSRSWWCRVWE